MTQSKQLLTVRDKTLGDVAVDGLLSGMAAGVAMAAYLFVVEWIQGQSILLTLARFDLTAEQSALTGSVLHLATSAVYGLVFALALRAAAAVRHDIAGAGWALGIAYGLGTFVLAWFWLLPVGSTLRGLGAVDFAIAHMLYGAVLGYQVGKHLRP